MRQIGNDTQTCEVKEASSKLPESVVETLSAFSNGTGGTLILGLSEKNGFTPVSNFNATAMQESLAAACAKMTPPVRPSPKSCLRGHQSPGCRDTGHVKERQTLLRDHTRAVSRLIHPHGRTATANSPSMKIDRLIEEHTQPTYDDEIVTGATLDDLDRDLVSAFIARQRALHPRVFASRDDETILTSMHVVHRDGDMLRPTLGGLMSLGIFPQQFFPRLNVTFTVFPGTTKAETRPTADDSSTHRPWWAPFPLMIDDAVNAVVKNMRTGAIIDGAFRKDVPDYPDKAVREAIANALMHRRLLPRCTRFAGAGEYVSRPSGNPHPGGLFGNVTIETLGHAGISASRNQFHSNILETTPYPGGGYVVENRGTGYQVIEEELQEALMPPPEPSNTLDVFLVDVRQTSRQRKRTPSHRLGRCRNGHHRIAARAKFGKHPRARGAFRTLTVGHCQSSQSPYQGRRHRSRTHIARSPKQRYRLKR